MAASSPNPDRRDHDLAVALTKQFNTLVRERSTWEAHWEEISQVVLPTYSRSFSAMGLVTPGTKRNKQMFDVTAAGALNKFAAAMESMITPRSSKWHRVKSPHPELMKIPHVARWYDTVNDTLWNLRYSPNANYAAQQHEAYISIGAFGTAALFVDEFAAGGIRYRYIPLGDLFIKENHQGLVDSVFRRFKLSARQAVQMWGRENLPEKVQGRLDDSPEAKSSYLHIVAPRGEEWVPGSKGKKGKPFASYYVCTDTQTMMSEGGYSTMPYAVARHLTAPGEVYGRSPAMTVLPGIHVLNDMKKTVLKQGHRTVDPILLAHDDGVLDGLSLRPGAVNFGGVNSQGQRLVHTLDVGRIDVGKELMDDERAAINDAFLVTLFQILVETPQMTATEVLERAREKGALLNPSMGRYQSEGIGPMIHREFDIALRQGAIPPPPPEVMEAGGVYKIEYDSPLTRAMRAEEGVGAMRTVQWASEIAGVTQNPGVMDHFDWDAMLPELADINGMPFRWVATPEAVDQKRKNRQMVQASQQLTQALPGMAAMAKAAAPEGSAPFGGQPQ